jgi:hypothetical protein
MDTIETLLEDDPEKWVADLPEFQRAAIQELRASGASYDDVAQAWITVSAENTYRFSASAPVGDKHAFLDSLRKEIRAFLCGDKKYKKERDGLFGNKGLARTYVVSTMAVAIAPHLSVASAVIAPLIALVLASAGKIALNAWCNSQPEEKP